jgi:NitT/TauT family transport system permease protein
MTNKLRPTYMLAGGFGLLLIWQLLASIVADRVFLPSPMVVASTFWDIKQRLFADAAISCGRVFSGYVLALVLGIPLGVFAYLSDPLNALLSPALTFGRYMPVAALLPVLILWFGIGEPTKIALIALGVVFQTALGVLLALRNVPVELVELATCMHLSYRRVVQSVIIPASLPEIVDICRFSLGWAWTYVVLAELVAADTGLGAAVRDGQRYLRPELSLASIIFIGSLGLCSDSIFRFVRNRAFPWYGHANR